MNISIPDYGLNIDLLETKVYSLVIENPRVYAEIVKDLWSECNGREGGIVFAEADKICKPAVCAELITNPFSVDCNNRKILAKLYSEIAEIVRDEDFAAMEKVNSEIVNLMDLLIQKVPYSLSSNLDMDIEGLLKLYELKVDIEETDCVTYLFEYMKLKKQICKTSCFFVLGLKNYLTDAELQALYRNIFYEKIHLILLEGGQKRDPLPEEKTWIFDKDLCIIELDGES